MQSSDQQVPWVATSHGHGSLDLHATLGYDNTLAHELGNDATENQETALSRISLRENGGPDLPNGVDEVDDVSSSVYKPVATIAPIMSLSSQNHVQPMIESVHQYFRILPIDQVVLTFSENERKILVCLLTSWVTLP